MGHPNDRAAKIVPKPDRVSPRHKIFEPIRLIVGDHDTKAHLLNISSTGALVHSAAPFEQGAAVHLELNGRRYQARVVWRDGVRFGITFGTPLFRACPGTNSPIAPASTGKTSR